MLPDELFPGLGWPRWAVMWGLALAIFFGLKLLTLAASGSGAARWKQAAYVLAWPGMDAEAFLNRSDEAAESPTAGQWVLAIGNFGFGMLLLHWATERVPGEAGLLWAWTGGVAIVLVLHFGLFHLLSCLWRAAGFQAVPIMHAPIASESLAEFWGRRWNLAFRDVAHRWIFRPLLRRWNATAALLASFLFSGLVHDLVISVPAGGGYGLPTLYFMLQGCSMLAERSNAGKSVGLGRGFRGRLFCGLIVLAPLPLLFHEDFVGRVLIPFLEVLGRLL